MEAWRTVVRHRVCFGKALHSMIEWFTQGLASLAQEVDAVKASEGRWPRICDRACAPRTPGMGCDHVL